MLTAVKEANYSRSDSQMKMSTGWKFLTFLFLFYTAISSEGRIVNELIIHGLNVVFVASHGVGLN